MTTGLTRQQHRLLAFIRAYLAENDGVSPSFAEMTQAVGLKSKSGALRLVEGLVERGYITRIPNRARTISLSTPGALAESERWRRVGYEQGYRAAVKEFGRRVARTAA
jgi:SOS-response transcriptional repressor LexA